MFLACSSARATAEPDTLARLPRYDLSIKLDTHDHRADIRQRVTWTNTTTRPLPYLVFNFYPHYHVPASDHFLLAKTLELLRLQPSLGIDRHGRHGHVMSAKLVRVAGRSPPAPVSLHHEYDADTPTTLRFLLPEPLNPGESVTVELNCSIHLPNKQGRWGHWQGVTYLTNALPLLAFCDESGWRPMPFVPWAQPWFNEAGVFTASITFPADQRLACPAAIKSETTSADGWKQVETEPFVGRDFSLLCSSRYREYHSEARLPDGRTVSLRCLAFPEHEFYATEILKVVGEAIPVFADWFGPFPYPQFTVAESFFGWNGNECAGLVMIDERIFGMPHLARGYVEYLVSHETCHQWWYNLVGTNGYAEPFVDEGAATYFTHRYFDRKHGRNNAFLDWPDGLKWLPNIHRENYRFGGMYAAIRNGKMQPAAQDIPKYGSIYGVFTGAYDRGSKVYGMIEDRLGEAAFFDFVRLLVAKYGWRVLQAADLRRELEAYTGRDWGEFFDRWVYGKGLTDWSIQRVEVNDTPPVLARSFPSAVPAGRKRFTVTLRQQREFAEPTNLGIRLAGQRGFPVRIPIAPVRDTVRMAIPLTGELSGPDADVTVQPTPDGTLRVSFTTSAEVDQIAVDPDGVLLDADPGNNTWRPEYRARLTPLYTFLDDTDLTNDYDRWNFTAGPWVWGASYPDPWYTRSTMAGLRAGVNRPNHFRAGAYAAYRTNYRDLVLGFDATIPGELQETGFNWERRIGGPWGRADGAGGPQRASAYHRWVLQQGASLYLPPMVYHEAFVGYQDNFLPFARNTVPGAVRWDRFWDVGWHIRANLYTPYWDPETGIWVDVTAALGQTRLPGWTTTGQFRAELAGVRQLPEELGPLRHVRVAGRLVGMAAFPDRGLFFPLGGGTLFRGYDLAERQGSVLWVANTELRVPVVREVEWDVLDHVIGARNVWLAAFYDAGDVHANGRSVGGKVAHALGAGVRVDVAVFSFMERATLRLDVGKTVNDATPFQVWVGVQHAF